MKLFKSLLLLCFALGVHAQTTTEFKTWTKLAYRIKPTKDLKIDIGGQYRTVTGDGFNRAIVELEVKKEMSKTLNYGVEFRHYFINDDFGSSTGIDQRSRLRLNLERTYSVPKGEFSMRYGVQHREIVTGGGSRKTDARVRALYALGIKDFKWDPEVYTEYLQTLNGDFDQRMRFGVATGNKFYGTSIGIGYFYQRNFTLTSPHYHTLSLNLRR